MAGVSALSRTRPAYAPGDVIDCGGYTLRLRVNARAKRISLRIDNRTGDAIVTAPRPGLLPDAVNFANSRRDWIVKTRRGQDQPAAFAPGHILSIRGHAVTLAERAGVITPRAEPAEDGSWRLISSGEAAVYARRIGRYLRQQALKTLEAETAKYVAMLAQPAVSPPSLDGGKVGRPLNAHAASGDVKVSLFDAKGRWGSCTPSRRTIRYSWRIIMAPKPVLSYLCAHEVAHLRHPDHSPAFWAEVARLYGGDFKPARQWLKTRGHELFRYQ